MVEEVLFGTFVFFVFYVVISNLFKYSKAVDYISSAFLSSIFVLLFYSSIPEYLAFVFCIVGPMLSMKVIFDDLFAISYKVKYYRNMLLHIIGFFIFALLFYVIVVNTSENTDLYFAIFLVNMCIFYCFYFVFGYRKLDEESFIVSPNIKRKRVIELGNFSNNQKDNLSTIPMSIEEIERAEHNAHDQLFDADMRKTEKIINIKRTHVLKSVSSNHSVKGE
jgi:hypothetical protein